MRLGTSKLVLGRVSFLVALICLWMSSGAELRHTDDVNMFRMFHAGQVRLQHSSPAPADIACVAHEWMNAWQTLHTARTAISWTFTHCERIVRVPNAALHLLAFDYTALRAPPRLLV